MSLRITLLAATVLVALMAASTLRDALKSPASRDVWPLPSARTRGSMRRYAVLLSVIEGGGNLRFVGTLYFPTQTLDVGGRGDVKGHTPEFAMIADQFRVHGNGLVTVTANSDFDADRTAWTGSGVRLTQ